MHIDLDRLYADTIAIPESAAPPRREPPPELRQTIARKMLEEAGYTWADLTERERNGMCQAADIAIALVVVRCAEAIEADIYPDADHVRHSGGMRRAAQVVRALAPKKAA